MPSNAELESLSNAFRAYADSLSTPDLVAFEFLLKNTLAIANIRNVQLWTRNTATRRNFLNRNISSLEFKMREALVRGIVAPSPPVGGIKNRTFDSDPVVAGRSLRRYLMEDYTRANVLAVSFSGGNLTYTYDSDASGMENDVDDDTDEFTDLADI